MATTRDRWFVTGNYLEPKPSQMENLTTQRERILKQQPHTAPYTPARGRNSIDGSFHLLLSCLDGRSGRGRSRAGKEREIIKA